MELAKSESQTLSRLLARLVKLSGGMLEKKRKADEARERRLERLRRRRRVRALLKRLTAAHAEPISLCLCSDCTCARPPNP
jgi:hypothetical protein